MDKQARLAAIMSAISELKEKEDQAIYGVELSLKTREWDWVLRNAQKLINIEKLRAELNDEAKTLQERIDEESREELL